jgi:hypothetical protein
VGSRDPARIECLCATGNSGSISAHNGNLFSGINGLGSTGGLLSTLATLSAALLLGEEARDPGRVDEVEGSTEGAEKDEVQEDAENDRLVIVWKVGVGGWEYVHLGVEDAGRRLNDGDSLVVYRHGEESALVVLENGDEVQAHILGVHIGTEAIRDSLLCTGGDLNVELLCSQVAQNLCIGGGILHQRTTNDGNTDGLWLVVGDGEDSLGGMSVDELHAEDLGLWERGGDLDIVVGCLRRFYNLFNVFDLVELLVQLQHIDVMHQAAACEAHLDLCEGIEGVQ